MLKLILVLPFLAQALIIFIDEFYFHRKRGLPLWEKIGHPLDTFTVIICYLFLISSSYSESNLQIYIGLCIFSSLFITKDEFVHTQKCEAFENWLHSLLFVLHPTTFFVAGYIWKENIFAGLTSNLMVGQTLLMSVFLFYQLFYWRKNESYSFKSKQ